MTFLELWLKMEGKDVAIPGGGLVILVTSMSVQVVAHTDGLHLLRQSRVEASDVVNLSLQEIC